MTLPPAGAADLIITGGTVLTVDAGFNVAEALAVRDGVIVAVGTRAQADALRGPATRVIELHEGAVLPGINDTHLHGAMVHTYWPHHWIEDAETWKRDVMPQPRALDTAQKQSDAVDFIQQHALSLGITSYTEPGLGSHSDHQHGGGVGGGVLRAYLDKAARRQLPVRVNVLLNFGELDGPCLAEDLAAGLAAVPASPDPRRLQLAGVKLFADGPPATREAWMHRPYLGTSADGTAADVGELGMVHGDSHDERLALLRRLIRMGHDAGLQVGVHATGSRTVEEVVRAFEDAMDAGGAADPRHYIIHGDCVTHPTLRRMAGRGIGMTTQPTIYATLGELFPEMIGVQAADDAFPLRWAMDAGVRLGLSSDAPIVTADWRVGMTDAVLRRGATADRERQRLSLQDAIRAYTAHGAWLDHAEHWKGSIEVGKVADLCLLERDPFAVPVGELAGIAVTHTIVDGLVAYRATP